jgi:hypothetical protein
LRVLTAAESSSTPAPSQTKTSWTMTAALLEATGDQIYFG